jgi:hypothetical protein
MRADRGLGAGLGGRRRGGVESRQSVVSGKRSAGRWSGRVKRGRVVVVVVVVEAMVGS